MVFPAPVGGTYWRFLFLHQETGRERHWGRNLVNHPGTDADVPQRISVGSLGFESTPGYAVV